MVVSHDQLAHLCLEWLCDILRAKQQPRLVAEHEHAAAVPRGAAMLLVMLASIPSPSFNGIHVGPFDVRVYGLMYVVGVLAAVAITTRRWEREGGSRELVYEVALWAFPAGLLGGRLYFLATSWNEVPAHWWGPIAVWDGGLGIWGGVALGAAVGVWVLRRRGADVARFMDAAVPGLLVAQAIGRIGNYFNQELFGGPTSLPWGLQIDPAHRPAGYGAYSTFHPTFLYELIWNLALAGALVWLGRHRRIRAPGLFALYVAGYSGFRIFEELLRTDPARHILGLRLNFFVAVVLCIGGLVWFVRIQRPAGERRRRSRGGPAALGVAGLTVLLAGCGNGSQAHATAPASSRSASGAPVIAQRSTEQRGGRSRANLWLGRRTHPPGASMGCRGRAKHGFPTLRTLRHRIRFGADHGERVRRATYRRLYGVVLL